MSSVTSSTRAVAESLGAIEIEMEAIATLYSELSNWVVPVMCDVYHPDDCLESARMTQPIFDAIFKDRLVHAIEAPLLFHTLEQIAGADRKLQKEEITWEKLRESLVTNDDKNERDEAPDGLAKDLATELYLLSRERAFLSTSHDQPIPLFFLPDEERQHILEARLKSTEDEIVNLIKILSTFHEERREESLSFWHFSSAQNLLGWSSLFDDEGKPFSFSERDGLRRTISYLHNVLSGLRFFRSKVKTSDLRTSNPDMLTFLASPAAALVKVDLLFGKSETKNEAVPEEREQKYRFAFFAAWIVKTLYDNEAPKTAADLADILYEGVDEAYHNMIEDAVGGWLVEAYDDQFTSFADAFSSFDSIASAATGSVVAKVAGGLFTGAKALMFAEKVLGKGKYFIPGAMIFATGQSSRFAKAGVLLGNIAGEAIKFEAYRRLAEWIGGETGAEIAKYLCMFGGGAVSSASDAVFARIADDLLEGKTNVLLEKLLERGLDDKRLDRLMRAAAQSSGNGRVPRPRGDNPENELVQRLRRVRAERAAAAQRAQREADRERTRLAREAQPAITRPERSPTLTATRTEPEYPGPSRKRRRTPQEPTRERRPSPVPAPELTPLHRAVATPPATLENGVLAQVSGGRVAVTNVKVQRSLAKFYQENPRKRSAMWRRLEEVLSGTARQIKTVKEEPGVFHVRVGIQFRLFFRRANGGIEITKIEKRGALGWSEA